MDDSELVWHGKFARSLYNHSWDLLDKKDRTDLEDHEMLSAAFASRHHWGVAGNESNWIVGDAHISRISAYLGHAEMSLHYAARALEGTRKQGWRDYRLASAFEVMARAQAAAGNSVERDRYLQEARSALDLIDDAEDRHIIEEQIASVPTD